jgi:uncharacterized RDD family membrane protein YckC
MKYAGVKQRVFSFLLDWLILGPICILILLLLNYIKPLTYFDIIVIVPLYVLIVPWLYFAICESSSSQASIGEKLIGFKVATIEGVRPSFLRISARVLICTVMTFLTCSLYLFLNLLIIHLSKRHQTTHDMITKCVFILKE